jgi:hypothetical protein
VQTMLTVLTQLPRRSALSGDQMEIGFGYPHSETCVRYKVSPMSQAAHGTGLISIRTDDCAAERVRICGSKQQGRTATSKALARSHCSSQPLPLSFAPVRAATGLKCGDGTILSESSDPAMQAVASRARLIAEQQLKAFTTQFSY